MRLFGLLVTYRRHEALADHLDALAKQTRRLDHLLVVDNGPTGVEEELVAAHPEAAHELEYLPMPDNLGPAGAIGRGLSHLAKEAADDDWVVLLDDDDPPRRNDMLETLLDFAEKQLAERPKLGMVGMIGARFDYSRGRIVRLLDAELKGAVPVDYVAGGQLPLIRMSAVKAVGGFTEDLFFGFDDLDYGLRLRRAGFDVLVHGEMAHTARDDAGRLGDTAGAPSMVDAALPWRRYYSVRNLVYILRSNERSLAAARVGAVAGIAKSGVMVLRGDFASAKLGVTAVFDGWTGRLGRRVEPVSKEPTATPSTSSSP